MSLSLEQRIANLSPEKRALLEKRLRQDTNPTQSQHTIPLCDRSQPLPLSFSQQRLWFLTQLQPGLTAYNTTTAYCLEGDLDRDALHQSLNAIVQRHESLRTTFIMVDGEPRQVINPPREFPLCIEDLSDIAPSNWKNIIQQRIKVENSVPFDLSSDLMRRAILLRFGETSHALIVTSHHIASDGWSNGIFWRELSALYSDFVADRPVSLRQLPIQFADYTLWQRQRSQEQAQTIHENYWKQQLAGAPELLNLPTDYQRPAICTFRGDSISFAIDADLARQLRMISRQTGSTLYMSLLAAFNVLLYRYTESNDIVVGTPIANRPLPELEHLIGFFANTLALRTRIESGISYFSLLQHVRAMLLDAYHHQETSFEQIVEDLQLERSLAYNPLVQVVFVLQNTPSSQLSLSGLKSERLHVNSAISKFDLTVTLQEVGEELHGRIEYSTDLFDVVTIERMSLHFNTLLRDIVKRPEQPIETLSILTAGERQQLLVEWNNTRSDYPRNQSLHEIFTARANENPHAIAVDFTGQKLSFSELEQRSNQLAQYLRKQGIGNGDKVGLLIERSLETIVGYLGILKAGAAYVPLPADYPADRLKFMIDDSDLRLILTLKQLVARVPTDRLPVCLLDDWAKLAKESAIPCEIAVGATDHAYVLYTSGSTGQPKGVAITHRNVVRLVQQTNYATFCTEDVVLQASTLAFDASTFEIWAALLNGAKLVIVPPGIPSMAELATTIQQHGITLALLPTGLFHLMVESQVESLRKLRQLLVGGDVLSPKHARTFLEQASHCQLINAYGPTENGTITCCYPITDADQIRTTVPIGRPISNTQVYVLDERMQPVPIGVVGELFTGGDGIADGYLNRPERTNERFIQDPFQNSDSERQGKLYRTGDLVRHRSDGNIEFVGRADFQVKIRGFRVELGEIEAVLARHPAVRQSVVVATEDANKGKELIAYFTAKEKLQVTEAELKRFLHEHLPDYMIPVALIRLDFLPITSSGKLDRAQLPLPSRIRTEEKPTAATDPLELQLVQIWEATLHLRPIGIRHNFFELGGNSLLAVQIFDRISRLTGKSLPLTQLFQTPTIEQLAANLRDQNWQPVWNSLVPVQPGGSMPPLFLVPPAASTALRFASLINHLDPDLPVYGLQHCGLEDDMPPHTTIETMAAYYVSEIQKLRPKGPYLLAGICFGAHVALEMAQQLRRNNEEIALLAILDARAPINGPTWDYSHQGNRRIDFHRNRLRRAVRTGDWRLWIDHYRKAIHHRIRSLLTSKSEHRRLLHLHREAQLAYQAQHFDGHILLLQSEEFATNEAAASHWRSLAMGAYEQVVFPGSTHKTLLLRDQFAQSLGKTLMRSINQLLEQRTR